MAKLTRKDKREQTEKANKELKHYILMEAHVRGNFHRALKRWLELIATSSADLAELERMYALNAEGLPKSETDGQD
jgi:hypothetical protein